MFWLRLVTTTKVLEKAAPPRHVHQPARLLPTLVWHRIEKYAIQA